MERTARPTKWFHFACVEIDPKAKPEGSRFCKSCRLGKDPRTGKKVDGRVQRAVEVIGVGAWWEEECEWWGKEGREGREGLNNGVSFKVCRGDLALNAFLLTPFFAARCGSRLIFQTPSILYRSTIISKKPRLELISFMSAQGASDYRFFD